MLWKRLVSYRIVSLLSPFSSAILNIFAHNFSIYPLQVAP